MTAVARRVDMMDDDDDDDDFEFWRFKDLQEKRIVTDRADLHRKQQNGFPHSVKLSKGRRATALFPRRQVLAWVKRQLQGDV